MSICYKTLKGNYRKLFTYLMDVLKNVVKTHGKGLTVNGIARVFFKSLTHIEVIDNKHYLFLNLLAHIIGNHAYFDTLAGAITTGSSFSEDG